MVYLTGDTHRDFDRVEEFCMYYDTEKDDVLIILGDAGINFLGGQDDRELKEQLSELPVTLLCIHGNHEMRPESISAYEETGRFGGTVYWEPEFPSLLFAKDGEIYELDGKRCIAIGGADSIDKYDRIRGVNWWEDEQPSDDIKDRVEERLEAERWRVDAVFSHTCPYKYTELLREEGDLLFTDQSVIDNSTEHWLDMIDSKLTYSRWYCGHYHIDRFIDKMQFMKDEVVELHD